MPPPGVKNDATPQRAKAKEIPPSQRFQYLNNRENFPLQIIQIIVPSAIATNANPMPRVSKMFSQALTIQLDISGQNQYISPTAINADISLITGAEVIKVMKLFLLLPDFLRCVGLEVLLGMALLYLDGGGEYYGAAACLFIKELAQGILYFSADEVCFEWMTAAVA